MRYLALLALVACAPRTDGRHDCYTKCGVTVIGSVDTCPYIYDAEKTVLDAYDPVFPSAYVCTVLHGATLRYAPDSASGHWVDEKLGSVAGIAYRGSHTIVLADVTIGYSAYPHEVGHLIDYATGINFPDDHYAWKERGHCASQARFWLAYGMKPYGGVCS